MSKKRKRDRNRRREAMRPRKGKATPGKQAPVSIPQALAQAAALREAGRILDAERLCRQVLSIDPGQAEAHMCLGLIDYGAGQAAGARQAMREAVRLDPGNPDYRCNLALAHKACGASEAAVAELREALTLDPDHIPALHNLGNLYMTLGHPAEAIPCYRKVLSRRTDLFAAQLNLGKALLDTKDARSALPHLQQAAALRPDSPEARLNLGLALQELEQLEKAVAQYEEAIRIAPDMAGAHNNLGTALEKLDRFDEAATSVERALALDPENAGAWNNLANIRHTQGRMEDALECCRRALALNPETVGALVNLCRSRKIEPGAAEFSLLEQALGKDSLGERERQTIRFLLAKSYNDAGDWDAAFAHYQEGNRAVFAGFSNPLGTMPVFVEHLERLVDEFRELRQTPTVADLPTRPIFIASTPRAGSTLLEQIVSSHPEVGSAGEHGVLSKAGEQVPGYMDIAPHADRHLASLTPSLRTALAQEASATLADIAPGHASVANKSIDTFFHIGLADLLFPEAPILHIRRHPLDACVSCYFQFFTERHEYAYDLDSLAEYYRLYWRLMNLWRATLPGRFLEIRYETLVGSMESEVRKILDWCGLSWDARCLAFHDSANPVKTASSFQVRQPVYQSSVGRWRHFEKHLVPLRDALADIIEEYEKGE